MSKHVKFVPSFSETEVDKFILHFKKVAQKLKWPRESWTLLLQSGLVGKARGVYSALSVEESSQYDTVKMSILKGYELPVGGPFDRIGVDIVQLPTSHKGNKYAVIFMDYLTKWPEVFPTKDQTSLIVAKLLVEHITPQHESAIPTVIRPWCSVSI